MRVFVTGAGGFVGRRLRPRLERAGHAVIGTDREVDVTDAEALRAALERTRPDAVVHLAAMSSVAESWRSPTRCYRLNFLGTRALLEGHARVCPEARVLLIGSADQYAPVGGEGQDRMAFSESTPLRPRSPYARTKAAAEALGTAAAEDGRAIVRVRAFNHTGAGQADAFVVSSFARQVAAIRDGRQAPVMRVGNLESVRDFLHVDDVLEAYVALLDPRVPPEVYNVAGGVATPIQSLLDRLLALAEISPRVETDPDRHRPTDWLVGDATRLRKATGWAPRISLDAILRELLADWTERDAR
ncbi:MAG: GDP-mannose 4,6-dehydratase [Myxococcota bacterium]